MQLRKKLMLLFETDIISPQKSKSIAIIALSVRICTFYSGSRLLTKWGTTIFYLEGTKGKANDRYNM